MISRKTSNKLFVLLILFAFAAQAFAQADDSGNYIVGGQTARPDQFPSFVSLRRGSTGHFCGAVLLNQRWALTAAYCALLQRRLQIQLVTSPRRNERVYNVVRSMAHPQYDEGLRNNDIGLVGTKQPIQLSNLVQPVRLPATDLVPGESRVPLIVAGLGFIEVSLSVSSSLLTDRTY